MTEVPTNADLDLLDLQFSETERLTSVAMEDGVHPDHAGIIAYNFVMSRAKATSRWPTTPRFGVNGGSVGWWCTGGDGKEYGNAFRVADDSERAA